MPKILLNVSDGQKSLWVGAAHDERVTLSEWIRRCCDAGLTAGAYGDQRLASSRPAKSDEEVAPTPAVSPVSLVEAEGEEFGTSSFSERVFRGPDPRGGLAAGDEGRIVAENLAGGGRAQKPPASHSRTPSEQSSPAASTCRRKHLHHINHGGNPCKECGWPT